MPLENYGVRCMSMGFLMQVHSPCPCPPIKGSGKECYSIASPRPMMCTLLASPLHMLGTSREHSAAPVQKPTVRRSALREHALRHDIHMPPHRSTKTGPLCSPRHSCCAVAVAARALQPLSCAAVGQDDAAAVWRGPMVMSALDTLMKGVAWAPLDVLVIDMPPGTGDAQLSITQRLRLAGAVIVSTPQVRPCHLWCALTVCQVVLHGASGCCSSPTGRPLFTLLMILARSHAGHTESVLRCGKVADKFTQRAASCAAGLQ